MGECAVGEWPGGAAGSGWGAGSNGSNGSAGPSRAHRSDGFTGGDRRYGRGKHCPGSGWRYGSTRTTGGAGCRWTDRGHRGDGSDGGGEHNGCGSGSVDDCRLGDLDHLQHPAVDFSDACRGGIDLCADRQPVLYWQCRHVPGSLNTNTAATTGDANIEIGQGRSGAGNAYLDLHAQSGTAYELRLIRASGANGNASLINNGTGTLSLVNQGGARVNNGTGDVWTVDAGGNETVTGSLHAPSMVLLGHASASSAAIAQFSGGPPSGDSVTYLAYFTDAAVSVALGGIIRTGAGGVNYFSASDRRLKQDIELSELGLRRL